MPHASRRIAVSRSAFSAAFEPRSAIATICIALSCAVLMTQAPTATAADSRTEGADILVPQDYPTISEALDNAWDEAVILVGPGTYNEAILMWGEIVLQSSGGPEVTIIDATGTGGPAVYMWGTMPGTQIEGFTIRGGTHTTGLAWGGGVAAEQSQGLFSNCIFRDNTAESGGGAAVIMNSNITFEDCTFIDNTADLDGFGTGGGAYVNNATAIFLNCTFESNEAASDGGALNINFAGHATLTDCTMIDNSAGNAGGAVAMSQVGIFTNCTFQNNTAVQGAGAFTFGSANATFNDCQFIGNVTSLQSITSGGGLHGQGNGSITLNGCTFSGNQAYIGGGAQFLSFNGTAAIDSCTFENNTGNDSGGGLAVLSSSGVAAQSTTFATNTSDRGGGAYVNNASVTFEDCTFHANTTTSEGNGAGINANASANVTLLQCTLTSNFVPGLGFGGGVYVSPNATVSMIGCFAQGNSTGNFSGPGGGGGAYVSTFDNPILNVTASVFCNNLSGNIVGPWNDNGGNVVQSSCSYTPPNNDPQDPQPIASGTVNGSFYGVTNSGSSSCDPDGVDVFYEYTVTGGPITLAIDTCGSTVNTALAIYDDKGAEIACSVECDGDPCDEPAAACLVVENLANGTYLIRVSQPSAPALGAGAPGVPAYVVRLEEIIVSTCPADITGDNIVGVPDLLAVINGWGACPDPCPDTACVPDINGDCTVGVPDLLAVINGWGPC